MPSAGGLVILYAPGSGTEGAIPPPWGTPRRPRRFLILDPSPQFPPPYLSYTALIVLQ